MNEIKLLNIPSPSGLENPPRDMTKGQPHCLQSLEASRRIISTISQSTSAVEIVEGLHINMCKYGFQHHGGVMISKLVSLFLFLGLFAFSISAQAATKAVIFGGYQYTHLDGGTNTNGFNGALTGNFSHYLGITADLSASYNSGFHFYTYTFGPQISVELPVIRPFAHVLLGGAKATSAGVSNSGFDVMVGGGVDVGHGLIGLRLGQFDWMMTRFSGVTDKKNVRFSSGLVFNF